MRFELLCPEHGMTLEGKGESNEIANISGLVGYRHTDCRTGDRMREPRGQDHNNLRSRDSQGGGAAAAAGGNNTAGRDFANHIDHQNHFQLQLRQLEQCVGSQQRQLDDHLPQSQRVEHGAIGARAANYHHLQGARLSGDHTWCAARRVMQFNARSRQMLRAWRTLQRSYHLRSDERASKGIAFEYQENQPAGDGAGHDNLCQMILIEVTR